MINNPPFITIFTGGIPTIKNWWFIIAIPTLPEKMVSCNLARKPASFSEFNETTHPDTPKIKTTMNRFAGLGEFLPLTN